MTFPLDRMFWLDGAFLWTNRNSFNINVSELWIVSQNPKAEVLAASDREDEKKTFRYFKWGAIQKTFVEN